MPKAAFGAIWRRGGLGRNGGIVFISFPLGC
jgi:hypothetical protein